jgi:hypothetical protein
VIRIAMLLFFLVVTMASARRASVTETIGPIVVYDWFWVGLAIALFDRDAAVRTQYALLAVMGPVHRERAPDPLGLTAVLAHPCGFRTPLARNRGLAIHARASIRRCLPSD